MADKRVVLIGDAEAQRQADESGEIEIATQELRAQFETLSADITRLNALPGLQLRQQLPAKLDQLAAVIADLRATLGT